MKIPETKLAKRQHIITTLLLIGLFLLANLGLNKDATWGTWIHELSNELSSKIAATLIAGTLIAYFFIYFLEKSTSEVAIDPVLPHERKKRFARELKEAESWYYCGNTASWNRVSTVPKLAKDARKNNQERGITLVLLNPMNDALCKQYADYRNKVRTALASSKVWDADQVRIEILTTIVECARTKQKHPLLKIEIYLRDWFTTFRYDFSQKCLLITREDNEQPAIEIEAGSTFYGIYKQEMSEIQTQCKQLVLTGAHIDTWDAITIADWLKDRELGINQYENYTSQIEKNLSNLRDPYA